MQRVRRHYAMQASQNKLMPSEILMDTSLINSKKRKGERGREGERKKERKRDGQREKERLYRPFSSDALSEDGSGPVKLIISENQRLACVIEE